MIGRWDEGMKYQKMKHPPHGIVQRLIHQNFEFVLFRRIRKCQVGHLGVHTQMHVSVHAGLRANTIYQQVEHERGHTLEKRGKVLEEL